MTKKVFISYSRRNQYIAERVAVDLKRAGCEVWYDQRSIPLNERWMQQIEKGIADHDHFLYLWSPEAGASAYVQREYEIACSHPDKRIAVARVAGNASDMDESLQALQHLDLGDDYWRGLRELFQWLDVDPAGLETPQDLVERGVDVRSAAEAMRDSFSWRVMDRHADPNQPPREFLRIPLVPKGYATSWLVAEATGDLQLQHQHEIQVVLKFSGDRDRGTVQEVLEYLVDNQIRPIMISVEGPLNLAEQRSGDRKGYEIPNDKPYIWNDCVDLAVKVISSYGRGRTVHFFLDSPQSLIFPIASRLREMFPYRVYNLNRNETAGRRYECVYTAQPS